MELSIYKLNKLTIEWDIEKVIDENDWSESERGVANAIIQKAKNGATHNNTRIVNGDTMYALEQLK